jgi:uncharacterized protein YgiB involved in biofilm formation
VNRKSSAYVTLALIGVLAGAGVVGYRSGETRRDVYTSLDNCKQDWGDTSRCEPVRDGRYSAGSYYGPVRSGGSAAGEHALTSTHVSRGGFGSLGAVHSSGS